MVLDDYDKQGIQEQMWSKFPDIHLTVKGKPWKKISTRKVIRLGFEPGPVG